MKTILCFGDSNTYGFDPMTGLRYPRHVRWTGRLQLLLGPDYRVIEEGCNGRTTVFQEPGEEWKSGLYAIKPVLNSHKPIDLVIMMLGSNDLKTYFHASAREIAGGAEKLVDKIQSFLLLKQGFVPEIILLSPPHVGEEIEKTAFGDHFNYDAVTRSHEFSKLYKEVADRKGISFLDAALYTEPSKADGLHLMPESHAALAEALSEKILGFRIRKSRKQDLDLLMKLYEYGRERMIETGNPTQWAKGTPSRQKILGDIEQGNSYVVEANQEIQAAFTFIIGPDPTYDRIEQGAWPNERLYGTIHRVASFGRMKGIFRKISAFCESVLDEVRVDTHRDNKIMQHLIESCGYSYCGIIYVADGSQRLAYQKSKEMVTESISYDMLIQYLLKRKTISLKQLQYQVVGKRTRMSDYGYEQIPDAEIAFETGEGQVLYAFAYEASAYEEYGIMDISWLDHDFQDGSVDREEHLIESFDSLEDSLQSPYARLYLELRDMLNNAEIYVDMESDEEYEY